MLTVSLVDYEEEMYTKIPLLANEVIAFWRCRCLSRRRFLNSLIAPCYGYSKLSLQLCQYNWAIQKKKK